MKKLCALAMLAPALLVGAPGPAAAQSPSANVRDYLGPFLDLGVSGRGQVFRVHSPDGPYGEFASTRLTPALTIGSPMLTWGEGDTYGLNLVWNVTGFAMDRQTSADGEWMFGDKKDVGTSLDGYASYLIPTVNFIGENRTGGVVDHARLGLGLGVGYLHARGDILLNRPEEGSDDEVVENPELRDVELDDVLPAFSIFMEGRRGPWTLALSVSGVAEFKSYETDYLDFALSLSYSWYRALRERPPAAPTEGAP